MADNEWVDWIGRSECVADQADPKPVRALAATFDSPAGAQPGDLRWRRCRRSAPTVIQDARRAATSTEQRCLRSAHPADYTPRVIPDFEGVAIPLEDGPILWQR